MKTLDDSRYSSRGSVREIGLRVRRVCRRYSWSYSSVPDRVRQLQTEETISRIVSVTVMQPPLKSERTNTRMARML